MLATTRTHHPTVTGWSEGWGGRAAVAPVARERSQRCPKAKAIRQL